EQRLAGLRERRARRAAAHEMRDGAPGGRIGRAAGHVYPAFVDSDRTRRRTGGTRRRPDGWSRRGCCRRPFSVLVLRGRNPVGQITTWDGFYACAPAAVNPSR